MCVGDKHLRGDRGQFLQVPLCRVERGQRRQVVHVTDVLAQPRILSVRDRHGVLEVGADGQRRRYRHRKRDRQRRVTARAPDRQVRRRTTTPHDGVVARDQDRPIMHQPAVGQLRKPFERIIVGVADRLSAEVARCHHERRRAGLVAGQPEEQRVQWGVGEHDAEVWVVRGHRIGDRGAVAAWHQHDRPLCTGQQARGPVVDLGDGVRSRQVGHHHGERFVAAPLSRAQLGDRTLVGGIAGEVVSADALDRDDAAVAQHSPCLPQRILAIRSTGRRCLGSAVWARNADSTRVGRGIADRRGRRIRRRSRRTS